MRAMTALLMLVLFAYAPVLAQENLVRNVSFENGAAGPAHWTLSGGAGLWEEMGHTGNRCISVEGSADNPNNSWQQGGIAVEPMTTYRFAFFARTSPEASGGCIISGPEFCNRDTNVGSKWARRSHVFVTGRSQREMLVRLGHWNKTGTVLFDDVAVRRVVPMHRAGAGITLGAGEKVLGGEYEFEAPLSGEGSNYSRPLHGFTAGFNSMRWVFGPGRQVVYRHRIGDAAQTRATVRVRVGYHAAGDCVVEVSGDGERFVEIGQLSEVGSGEYAVPADMLPATEVFVRLRSPGEAEAREDSHPGSFQVHGYTYAATLAGDVADATGATRYLDIDVSDPRIAVEVLDLGSLLPGGENAARVRIANRTDRALDVTVGLETLGEDGSPAGIGSAPRAVALAARGDEVVAVDYSVSGAGEFVMRIAVNAGDETLFAARSSFSVASLYASDFGHPVRSDSACDLWWCEGTHKVSRERPSVAGEAGRVYPVRVSMARNEFEPVQVVLRPSRALVGLTAEVSDLVGPNGARLDADNIEVCYVWYHHVKRATDRAGCVGWWPDALPPLDEPIDLEAGRNQPLWITIKTPKATPAGEYSGTLSLRADGWETTAPVALTVWDFALPDESRVASGFELSSSNIWRYQNIKSDADKDEVWDLYMQNFRDHRISPYNFWRRGIQVEFTGATWTGGTIVGDDAFEGEHCLEIVDASETGSAYAAAAKRVEVDPEVEYVLTFAAKTAEPGQKYLVTFQSYDTAGQWISGHNLDVAFTGTGEWAEERMTFVPANRSPNARSLLLLLRPARWTDAGELTGTAWFDDMKLVAEGSDENLIPAGGFEAADESVHAEVDFTDWDKEAAKYLDGYGFSAFRLALSGMGSGTFHSRHYGRIGPYEQGTPEYRRVFGEYLGQLQDHLAEKGWLEKAYIYWFDEPAPKDYEFVREGMAEIKLAGPKLRRMLTEEPTEPLFGAVDLWCPVLHNHNAEACAARQDAGESIWWYVCCGPKAPWPGLFIDHSAVDLRVWLWMTWKWNVEGILVWQSNYWTSSCAYPDEPQNPWEDPMGYVSGYSNPPGYIGYWGNGDGRFLYPANKGLPGEGGARVTGPVNSIRWEMLREGIEDFEYFALLKELVAKRGECPESALLEVPEEIVGGQTEFTKDPAPMYAHREKLARAIVALSGD